MAESIAARVGRIIAAGFHSFIEAMDNAAPEVVMERALHEIDATRAEVRAQLGQEIAKQHLAQTRLQEEQKKYDELSRQVDLALTQDRQDLAEVAIAKQLDIEVQIPVLEAHVTESSASIKELEGYLQALQARKREMQEELRTFQQTSPPAEILDSTVKTDAQLAELDELVRKQQVAVRLAAAKARLKKS